MTTSSSASLNDLNRAVTRVGGFGWSSVVLIVGSCRSVGEGDSSRIALNVVACVLISYNSILGRRVDGRETRRRNWGGLATRSMHCGLAVETSAGTARRPLDRWPPGYRRRPDATCRTIGEPIARGGDRPNVDERKLTPAVGTLGEQPNGGRRSVGRSRTATVQTAATFRTSRSTGHQIFAVVDWSSKQFAR